MLTSKKEIQEFITSLKMEQIFIGVDVNGRHTLWGYRDNDARVENVLDSLLVNDLYVINIPDALPTFQRDIYKSWPDLTTCTQDETSNIASATINTSLLIWILKFNNAYLIDSRFSMEITGNFSTF
ncbi:hypothetical protein AVEN_89380-1 [Araneus ventricosus]|uniref:Endonuclease/exonuclease/phosphatase domain-containing protein n=1 Tax=Araneus ventricosus TaxID=182803 RepID=A0A4Y2LKP6_ARAVE|nr:hypothetical protein AVEN_89380-1 [Araneus ventricosus]